jgi:hypothetical protein
MSEPGIERLRNTAVVVALSIQLGALVWGAATLSASVRRLEERLGENATETRVALRDMAIGIKELTSVAAHNQARIDVLEDRARRKL